MELRNSYIFLNNPHTTEGSHSYTREDGTQVLSIGKSLHHYINSAFPDAEPEKGYGNIYTKKYSLTWQCKNIVCQVDFIATEVVKTYFLDIYVRGNTKHQAVECLEDIHHRLLASGICKRYIDILSYDAISEFYCNKMYPQLNNLERHLRQLLFNVYVVHFGEKYYETTIDSELQAHVKELMGADINTETKKLIKTTYNVPNNKEATKIFRLQHFFYSLTYSEIQKMLFTPHANCTENTENRTNIVADNNMSTQISDWDIYFSDKVNHPNIQDLIERMRIFRNRVAHCKFFFKNDFTECKGLSKQLSDAISIAISLTEDQEFARKNAASIAHALEGLLSELAKFMDLFSDIKKASERFSQSVAPVIGAELERLKKNTLVTNLGRLAIAANTPFDRNIFRNWTDHFDMTTLPDESSEDSVE